MSLWKLLVVASSVVLVAAAGTTTTAAEKPSVTDTTCNGRQYKYRELVGYGTVPGNARDEFGDTLNFGSALAMDRKSWKKLGNGSYTGVVWALPDRGW